MSVESLLRADLHYHLYLWVFGELIDKLQVLDDVN